MDLTERGGGQRDVVEVLEGVRHPHAELGLDRRLDLGEAEGLDVVLEAGERIEVRGRRGQGGRSGWRGAVRA